MQNILFVCNTYYQLIMAINMRITLFKNDKVTLLLSNHSKNADVITQNLKNLQVFDKTEYIKTKDIDYGNKNKLNNLYDYLKLIFGKNKKIKDLVFDTKYNKFLYFNQNLSSNLIFNILVQSNKYIETYQFEEGILSYPNIKGNNLRDLKFGRTKLWCILRKIFSKPILIENTKKVFCLYPDLYFGKLAVEKIPVIKTDGELTNILKRVFNVDINKKYYQEKYIYFSSICDFEGGKPIGEFKLIKNIAQLVGKDNLLIKLHPRDVRDIYKKEGLKIAQASSIPWEVMQLLYDFEDKVFLTATSSSVLMSAAITGKSMKAFYLYKLCNIKNNYIAENTVFSLEMYLKNFESNKIFSNIIIAKNIEEILH